MLSATRRRAARVQRTTSPRDPRPLTLDPSAMRPRLALSLVLLLAAPAAGAQEHVHTPGMQHDPRGGAPATPEEPGQAAFAAIAEVVRMLDADSTTDWRRVDVERLRAHLRDMDEVTLRADVRKDDVPGGARFTVRGTGRTVGSIQRMARAHSAMLGAESPLRATVEPIVDGARVTIVAADTSDARAAARVRALGFAGALTLGGHHGPHHLAIARGTMQH